MFSSAELHQRALGENDLGEPLIITSSSFGLVMSMRLVVA